MVVTMKKRSTRSRRALAGVLFAAVLGASALTNARADGPAAIVPGTPVPAATMKVVNPLVPSYPGLSPDLETLQNVGPSESQPLVVDHATLLKEGAVLYADHCMSCHGENLQGTSNVPSLVNMGGAGVSFFVSTGRMPGAVPGTQSIHEGQHFNTTQTNAIIVYVNSRTKTIIPIPNVQPDPKLLVRGRQLFENDCEMCHGAAAQGAIVGYGWVALNLGMASPTEIGEAIRVGPGVMPRFTPAQLSDGDISALATYVHYIRTTPQTYGGTTGGYLGVIIEGFVGLVVGGGGLFWVIFFTGTKTSGTRVHES